MTPRETASGRTERWAKIDLAAIRTVVIGHQEWSAENLAVAWPGSWPPHGDENLVGQFGRLYTHGMALEIAARVPGWRLPTKADVEALIAEAGGHERGAAALKAGGRTGFAALYAGFREPEDSTFRRTGRQTGFWTATATDAEEAWKFWLRAEDDEIRLRPVSRQYGDSIRLVRNR